jgi:hypothetical protein
MEAFSLTGNKDLSLFTGTGAVNKKTAMIKAK